MKELHKDIARNFVQSTKKWLCHYLLDHFDKNDSKYFLVKQAVKDIHEFQDAILEQLDKEDEIPIIGENTYRDIKSIYRKEIANECEEAIEDELIRLDEGTVGVGQVIYHIMEIIRGDK